MKKLLYSVLALAGILAVSCNKEAEAPVANEHNGKTHTVTLKAAFAQEGETRTEYANDKTFSWVKGDIVYVRCASEEEWYWAKFEAQTDGATTDLVGEVDEGFEPYDVAVYAPGDRRVISYACNGSTVSVVTPISYHLDGYGLTESADGNSPYWNSISVPSDNPLSLLPLVSVTKDEVLYFQTAMGVLNLNLTEVSSEATHIRITSGDKYLGNYLMVQDGMITNEDPLTEEDEDGESVYATSFMEYYFQPTSDGNVSLMIPLPVGTLGVGTSIEVRDANDAVLFAKTTKKDIVVERNKITKLVPLAASASWETLGTGKFVDNYLWSSMGAQDDTYVDVEIQKSLTQDGYYRIVNPYGAAAKAFNYKAPYTVKGPQDLVFHVMAVGEKLYSTTVTLADQIYYSEVNTGIDASDDYLDDDITGDDLEYVAHHPGDYRAFSAEEKWGRNIIAKYGADGNPANVIVAPIYLWGADSYWSGNNPLHETNNVIQILFPGVSSAVELDSSISFGEVTDDTPEQAVASASINLGNDVVSAKVVIATDLAAAKAAIAANQNVTEVTASGEIDVLFPANAPSGDYMVFAYTQAKDGFTEAANQYIYSASFKYFNSNDDAGYTLADIVGVYDSAPMHIAYYNNGWNWGDGKAVNTITIEESDDDFLGNIMITEIECTAETRGYTLVTGSGYGPLYGTFNTATGEVLIPLGSLYWEQAEEGVYWVGSREDDGTDMFMDKPGHLTMENARNFLGVMEDDGSYGGYIYRILGGYTNYTYTYTRRSSASVASNRVRRASTNFVEIVASEAPSLSKENDCKVPFGALR